MTRLRFSIVLALLLPCGVSQAQDAAQLQKLYDDTLVQLQQSQDRKNQLANENAKLNERVAELETQLRTLQIAADRAELMAAQYAAFRSFLVRYPALRAHFSQYPGTAPAPERDLQYTSYEFFDRNWPFSAISASEGG